ncbi:tautomerase family protein [Salinisphaera hydrothermalis]|uniref:tautomerase family protein n=1 Tax=Salinisphaera hydrothermalis TaxID=563188 RepID=UPI003340FD72
MPHVNLKIATGHSDTIKHELADAFARALVEIAGAEPSQISVAIDDVAPKRWARDVYQHEIAPKTDVLYRLPGYNADDLCR